MWNLTSHLSQKQCQSLTINPKDAGLLRKALPLQSNDLPGMGLRPSILLECEGYGFLGQHLTPSFLKDTIRGQSDVFYFSPRLCAVVGSVTCHQGCVVVLGHFLRMNIARKLGPIVLNESWMVKACDRYYVYGIYIYMYNILWILSIMQYATKTCVNLWW